ncbi:hypothetical protein SAMN05216308_11184 [Nitrosospira sp. Nsp13]|nr:hypothetical protein SAMN05216308_11184 [Nitrosospira sp. Nsp13]
MSHKYLLKRRLKSVWHPCTQMKQHDVSLVPIDRGRGIWLHDFEDRCYLDAIRSVHSEQEMDLLAAGLCRRLIHSKN